jgi:hypothetical protein
MMSVGVEVCIMECGELRELQGGDVGTDNTDGELFSVALADSLTSLHSTHSGSFHCYRHFPPTPHNPATLF